MGLISTANKISRRDPTAGSVVGVIMLHPVFSVFIHSVIDPFKATGNECCPMGTKNAIIGMKKMINKNTENE